MKGKIKPLFPRQSLELFLDHSQFLGGFRNSQSCDADFTYVGTLSDLSAFSAFAKTALVVVLCADYFGFGFSLQH